jgi:hypothetical protein
VSKNRLTRTLFLVAGILLVIQIPWFFGATAIADKQMVKTTATVIRVDSVYVGRGSARSVSGKTLIPVYEYYDRAGNRYEIDDRYFGSFKENNPLRGLFLKQVGDKATTYYPPEAPDQPLFMASLLAYSAWIIPLYLTIPVVAIGGVSYIFRHRKDIDLHSLKQRLGARRR